MRSSEDQNARQVFRSSGEVVSDLFNTLGTSFRHAAASAQVAAVVDFSFVEEAVGCRRPELRIDVSRKGHSGIFFECSVGE